MGAGDREVVEAFEEVITRNVRSVVNYSDETRKIVRELERHIDILHNQVVGYQERLEQMQSQVAALQAKVYAGGTA